MDFDYPRYFSLLHLAVGRRHRDIVEYLLDHGADVHAPARNVCCDNDGDGYYGAPLYPLHFCLDHTLEGMFQLVWGHLSWSSQESGTDYGDYNHFEDPSHFFTFNDRLGSDHDSRTEIAALLIDRGAFMVAENVSAIPSLEREGQPDLAARLFPRSDPLSLAASFHVAAMRNDLSLARQLIQRGADAAIADFEGVTALHLAVRSCKDGLELVRMILQQPRVDAGAQDHYHRTALHHACENGNDQLVRLLLAQPGLSVAQADDWGATALHYVCRCSQQERAKETVRLLILTGAQLDPDYPNRGNSPLATALQYENFRTAAMLVSSGCDPSSWCSAVDDLTFNKWISRSSEEQIKFTCNLVDTGVNLEVSSDPRRMDLKATLVYFAASSLNVECMRILFTAGMRADSVVVDSRAVGAMGELRPRDTEMTLLVAILYRLWGSPNRPHSLKKTLVIAREVVMVLLEHGAPLGQAPRSNNPTYMSALDYALSIARFGDSSLMQLLMDWSTARNVDQDFLQRFMRRRRFPTTRLRDAVKEFHDRIFPQRAAEMQGGDANGLDQTGNS